MKVTTTLRDNGKVNQIVPIMQEHLGSVMNLARIKLDDGEYVIVYNTINQSLIRIHRGDYVVDNDKLIKGGFVVEDDCDEVLLYENYYLKQLYKEYALNVTISTTLDCNLHCPYCFEEGHKRDVYLSKEGCDKYKRCPQIIFNFPFCS